MKHIHNVCVWSPVNNVDDDVQRVLIIHSTVHVSYKSVINRGTVDINERPQGYDHGARSVAATGGRGSRFRIGSGSHSSLFAPFLSPLDPGIMYSFLDSSLFSSRDI